VPSLLRGIPAPVILAELLSDDGLLVILFDDSDRRPATALLLDHLVSPQQHRLRYR
jgi:hypothetical protein